MYVFIITSAINSVSSVMDFETRFNDTFKTIESIRNRVPDSYIVLSESSSQKLPREKLDQLREKVDQLYVLSDIPLVRELGEKFLKSPAEATNMSITLRFVRNLNLPNVKRVFKVTGRGYLNDKFIISHYEKPELYGKYVFKKRIVSWVHPSISLLSTRCWSFCYSLLPEVEVMMQRIYEGCMRSGHDLEHITFAELDLQKLTEVEPIGFSCQISRTGEIEHD